MRYRSADHVMAKGELLRRMEANLNRLKQPEYSLEYIRTMDENSWPGDYRGRALLAMTQLCHALNQRYAGLETLAEDTLAYLSERGYGGDDANLNAVNEQQLAGHSWLMRALLAYGEYAGDARFDAAAKRLFENLFCFVASRFDTYPLPNAELDIGGPAGTIIDQITDGWKLSSDCGCVFIALDGLSEYFVRTGDERAKAVFHRLAKRFAQLDPVKARFQTHATLSALRGLMRMYSFAGEKALLDIVTDRFEKYLTQALTLNYANYNWFGRPRWTECCAVVDSYLLSKALWCEGLGDRYIEIAERILYNGLMAGQRENGGFGSDCCLTDDGSVTRLVPHPDCYEAFWCCTMRGAEGLTSAVMDSVQFENGAIHVTGWHPGKYVLGDTCVEIQGNYPWEDRGAIIVTGNSPQYDLRLYPADAPMAIIQNGRAVIREEIPFAITAKCASPVEVSFDLSMRKAAVATGKILWKGPLMLDCRQRPLSHRMYMPAETLKDGMQIIF